MWERDLK